MSKPVYEQLHLKLEGFNQVDYDSMYDRLLDLKLGFKKKFYFVYLTMLDIVLDEIDIRALDLPSTLEERNNKHSDLRSDKDILTYFESVIENDNSIEFEDIWLNRFDSFKEEMNDVIDYELVNLEVQLSSIISLLEYFLIKEDEYWIVNNNFTLFLLRESGFKFEKADDRVWQPKTGSF